MLDPCNSSSIGKCPFSTEPFRALYEQQSCQLEERNTGWTEYSGLRNTPTIDAVASVFDHLWKGIQGSFSSINSLRERSCTRVVRKETCPIMATWSDFTKRMCGNGGRFAIPPFMAALRGFSKIIPAEPHSGAWYNRENAKVYLDIVAVYSEKDVERAIQFAKEQE